MPFDGLRFIGALSNPAAEILLDAEVKFLSGGWVWVGEYPERGRNACLVSALISATRQKGLGNHECDQAYQLVARVIGLRSYKRRRDMKHAIACWNDAEGRTFADIVQVLRQAQKLAYAYADEAGRTAQQQELELA
jgi:hypothetical protein